jgi:hypothetical protein
MGKFLNASRFFALMAGAALFYSCSKPSPCPDLNQHKAWLTITKQWQDTTTSAKRNMADTWGLDEMLVIDNPYEWEVEGSVIDECNKSFTSYKYSAVYTTALSNYRFEIKFQVAPQALFPEFETPEENYITLEILYRHLTTQGHSMHSMHSMQTNVSLMPGVNSFIRQQHTINDVEYAEVLEVNFQDCTNPSALSQINYAKGAGIVSFTTCGGNTFVLK